MVRFAAFIYAIFVTNFMCSLNTVQPLIIANACISKVKPHSKPRPIPFKRCLSICVVVSTLPCTKYAHV